MTAVAVVGVVLLLVCLVGYELWDEHPGVRMKREIRRAVQREDAAHRELDDAHAEAKAEMDRRAREWDS